MINCRNKNRGWTLMNRGIALVFLALWSASSLAAMLPFEVGDHKHIRVMISSDAKNEADDDFAVAHALMTPTLKVTGLIAAHYARTAPMMKREGPTA